MEIIQQLCQFIIHYFVYRVILKYMVTINSKHKFNFCRNKKFICTVSKLKHLRLCLNISSSIVNECNISRDIHTKPQHFVTLLKDSPGQQVPD